MNLTERQNRIVEYLQIKPISHGQVYTLQIAVPKFQAVEISPQRHEALKTSLIEQGSNLVPLIVRRTEAYSEEEEYEAVYGADWCVVAKELDIEKLWVWVFDMTDEQAAAAKFQMEQLVNSLGKPSLPNETEQIKNLLQQVENSFQLKIENFTKEIEQYLKKSEEFLINQLEPFKKQINLNLDEASQVKISLQKLEKSTYEQILSIKEEIKANGEKTPVIINNNLNLLTAKQKEVCDALIKREKAKSAAANAAWNAIEYWKKKGELTWENLEKSTKARGEHKVPGFAKGSYQKLQAVAKISN